jgi:hypothetical protein
MAASPDDAGPLARDPGPVDTAAVMSSAMTDYLLANGTNKAPATQAPAYIASSPDNRGYHIVRLPVAGPVDLGDPDLVARVAALIEWGSVEHEDDKLAIVRQVLSWLAGPSIPSTHVRRAA